MSEKARIMRLRSAFNKARRKGKLSGAREALEELAVLEPLEPRWPHQLGEVFHRTGDDKAAADAYEKATRLYAQEGFVARAVAMAKTLLRLDPSRSHVLEAVDPSAAREKHRAARPAAVQPQQGRMSLVLRAPVLEPAHDQEDDEVRFTDLTEDDDVIELDFSELELISLPEPQRSVDRLALMPAFPLFAELPPDKLRALADGADLVELPAGAQVIERGEPADSLYCIVEGSVSIDVPGLPRSPVLGEGDVFGESCLLDGATRQADVHVREALTALSVPRAVLDLVVEGAPELDDLLFELLARRVIGNFLATSPLFTVFDPSDRRTLARSFELRRARANVALMRAGKRSDGLYALVQGKVEVGGQSRGPGAILGVRALLSKGPAEEDAITTTECVLLRLPASKFNAFVATFPPALAHLSELASAEGSLAPETVS